MGWGSIRAFLEALDQATAQLPPALPASRRCSWVVGGLVGPALQPVVERLQAVQGLELLLHALLPRTPWDFAQNNGALKGTDVYWRLRGAQY